MPLRRSATRRAALRRSGGGVDTYVYDPLGCATFVNPGDPPMYFVPENVLCIDRVSHTIDNRATNLLPHAAVSQTRLCEMMGSNADQPSSTTMSPTADPLVRDYTDLHRGAAYRDVLIGLYERRQHLREMSAGSRKRVGSSQRAN